MVEWRRRGELLHRVSAQVQAATACGARQLGVVVAQGWTAVQGRRWRGCTHGAEPASNTGVAAMDAWVATGRRRKRWGCDDRIKRER